MEIGEVIAMESKGMFEKNLRFAYWYVRKHFSMYADDEDIMQDKCKKCGKTIKVSRLMDLKEGLGKNEQNQSESWI